MGSKIRKTAMERVATLLAAPVLLLKHAVDLAARPDERPRHARAESSRVAVVPPKHSVMRRG